MTSTPRMKPALINQGTQLINNKNKGKKLFSLLVKSKTGLIGVILVVSILLISIFAPFLATHDPAETDPIHRLQPPVWLESGTTDHVLGTDNLGRDIWSRLVYGSRISIIVGIGAVIVSGSIGSILGLLAGYHGRWVNALIMRLADSFLAIPTILLMLVVLAVVGPGIITLIFVIGVTNWVSYARVIRGEVLSIKEQDYIKAAKGIGAKNNRILFRHILPNVYSSLIVISTLNVATAIILEASLSFLGLGIKPPDVSWGGILSDGRQYIATSWWVATFPGLAITITVLGIIFLGDWLRDVIDPHMKTNE
ncbi:ABC transporter permease [Sporosarcina sp. FA9]|uniref:ABC transporter permease n=1 Tax=Sporosarcina sp. FA9 TaxID=3413030 RepID=UPI003F65FEDE